MARAKTETMFDQTVDNVKWVGNEVKKVGRNSLLFGLGAVATAEDEVRGLVDRMVRRGETFRKDEDNYVGTVTGKVKDLGRRVEDQFQGTMSSALNRVGVPSRDEIRTLILRVEELTAKVDSLGGRGPVHPK